MNKIICNTGLNKYSSIKFYQIMKMVYWEFSNSVMTASSNVMVKCPLRRIALQVPSYFEIWREIAEVFGPNNRATCVWFLISISVLSAWLLARLSLHVFPINLPNPRPYSIHKFYYIINLSQMLWDRWSSLSNVSMFFLIRAQLYLSNT